MYILLFILKHNKAYVNSFNTIIIPELPYKRLRFKYFSTVLLLFIKTSLFLASILVAGPAKAALTNPADSTRSSDIIVAGTFANDATFRTDYYYTQGLGINLVHPGLAAIPVNKILLRPAGTTRYHGIQVQFDTFTPLKILDPNIRYGDRPYAGYIYATQYLIANNAAKKQRLTSGLALGFMGPGAGAKQLQIKAHELLDSPKPLGWDNQLRTDLILGYQAGLEKQLIAAGKVLELIGQADASVGTLYTGLASGLFLRAGKMNSYFQNLGITAREDRRSTQKFQFYAQGSLTGKVVGYNATLQGGLLNNNNPYTLPDKLVKRTVLQKTAGLVGAYGGVSFESSVVWITPEFKGARPHQWMYFELRFIL
jgi:lipid A 3-O-deacylase